MQVKLEHSTFNIQRRTLNRRRRHPRLDVECWALNVECFPAVEFFNRRTLFGKSPS
jgi:hypothetical protein